MITLMLMNSTFVLSLIFMFLSHPMSMGLTLLMQTLFITMTTGFSNSSFWYSYIMFLIMVGGMLVLFIYMTSIASNEKFKFSKMIVLTSMSMIIPTMILYYLNNIHTTLITKNTESMQMNQILTFDESMTKFINQPSNSWMYMIIIYLLITMIAIVKMTNMKMGALRQKS